MSDPIWLTKVLRAAGLTVHEYPGAYERGHGDVGEIWGVVAHHTGSFGETPRGIAEHPSLGLASQLYLSRDGEITLCGVGVAWHAGTGSWPGIPANNANGVTIGIEAANDGGGTPGKPHHSPWSNKQYGAYVRTVAAILNHIGKPSSHVIGHKEWAAIQGKWDPGGINMDWFRRDVAKVQAELSGAQRPVQVRNEINFYSEQKENLWIGLRTQKGERVDGINGKARTTEFSGAVVYWSPTTGAHAVPRADPKLGPTKSGLYEDYMRRGGATGELGLPVREFKQLEAKATRPRGAVQAFEHGVLYRKDGDRLGFVVHGVIGDRWGVEGYENSTLGFPISDEQTTIDGGKIQFFEGGTLSWHPSGATREISAADVKVVKA